MTNSVLASKKLDINSVLAVYGSKLPMLAKLYKFFKENFVCSARHKGKCQCKNGITERVVHL